MSLSSTDGMLAAVAGADITPAPGMVLQGHWSRNPSHEVLFPLETRALVFRNRAGQSAAIVSLDVMAVGRESTARIRQAIAARCGICGQGVVVAASHTHCAPAMLETLGLVPDAAYVQRVEQAAVDCVVEAAGRLQPVTLGLGCASACFNTNRRPLPGTTGMAVNAEGLVDRRARFLRVDHANGSPLAVLFHYSCHPTTLSGSKGRISPDYPGIARSSIESMLGCQALFLQGCCGNIRPAILDEQGRFKSATKEELEATGQALGKAVARAVAAVRTQAEDRLSAMALEVDFPFASPPSIQDLQAMMAQTTPVAKAIIIPWAEEVLRRIQAGTLPAGERSTMQYLRLGPLGLLTIPAEPVQEIGHAVEQRLIEVTDAQEVWPVGYANDMIGYMVTERQHGEGGYEPNAYPYYGRPAPWRNAEAVVVEHALHLVGIRKSAPVMRMTSPDGRRGGSRRRGARQDFHALPFQHDAAGAEEENTATA